jgi:hypothetical protein
MGSAVIYSTFPTLTPTGVNKVVGGIHVSDVVYCRHCIDRLALDWNEMKYLTNSRANLYKYNCYECGFKITFKSANRT